MKPRKILKQSIKRLAPSVVAREERARAHQEHTARTLELIQQALAEQSAATTELLTILKPGGGKLESLNMLLDKVEHYQPLYGLGGIIQSPARSESKSRAEAIASVLQPLAGKRILDIGSSLGYFCFYLSDRGVITEGWESNEDNCQVSRIVQEINGLDAKFKVKELNEETIDSIPHNQHDAILVLSVFHHIIRFQGLAQTKMLVKKLMDRSPIMIVELARKGEDPKLPWDKSQPQNELEIFDLVKEDVTIHKIGDFPNHLSKKTRPLYVIQKKKSIAVGGKTYAYKQVSGEAYSGSGASPLVFRRYYFGDKVVVKEYQFDKASREQNEPQILREISVLADPRNKGVYKFPKLLSYGIDTLGHARIAIEKDKGKLLSDITEVFDTDSTIRILVDLSRTLADLEQRNLYHNDIRSWNIIINNSSAVLIDYGLADSNDNNNNTISFLWVANKLLTGAHEGFEQAKSTLPDSAVFKTSKKLGAVYSLVSTNKKTSFKNIHDTLRGVAR